MEPELDDMENVNHEPLTPEQQQAHRVDAIAGLDILIERGGSDLLISSYRAQRAWLASIDDGSTNDAILVLKSDYFRQYDLYAKSVQ
jgi:hypothetical protein